MKNSELGVFGVIFLAAIVGLIVLWQYQNQRECENSGGVYVSVTGGHKCIYNDEAP